VRTILLLAGFALGSALGAAYEQFEAEAELTACRKDRPRCESWLDRANQANRVCGAGLEHMELRQLGANIADVQMARMVRAR
jgi:hypothetical protein